MSQELIQQLAVCIERGKVNKASPYPPDLKDQDGADELTKQALDMDISASEILEKGLVPGMAAVGQAFSENKVFIPDLLMAAKAMQASMVHLKPHFESGAAVHKGTLILGTVKGDLHDIGKNLVGMIFEGGGYQVIDLGVDVSEEKFVEAVKEHPNCIVGLSALLTTTMVNMQPIVEAVKAAQPGTRVLVGGAPLTDEFAEKIGADAYAPDPHRAVALIEAAC